MGVGMGVLAYFGTTAVLALAAGEGANTPPPQAFPAGRVLTGVAVGVAVAALTD